MEAELRFGAVKLPDPSRSTRLEAFFAGIQILPFDSAAAKEYAVLRAHLERAGTPIGRNDLLIASIALAHNLILVTHNAAEFARVPGLVVEDGEA